MSWYLFKDAPAHHYRGIKVDGYRNMHRQHLNLSWGMNQQEFRSNSQSATPDNTIPATMTVQPPVSQENMNNIKVLTETSDDEQEELMKLIKAQNEKRMDYEASQKIIKNRGKSMPFGGSVDYKSPPKQQKSESRVEMNKRIRYLQNSLLPSCKRDTMSTILDYNLNKEVPLQQSRLSGKSVLRNKKNESSVALGDGYNVFVPIVDPPRQLHQKLKDIYDYEQTYNKRMERSNIKFG